MSTCVFYANIKTKHSLDASKSIKPIQTENKTKSKKYLYSVQTVETKQNKTKRNTEIKNKKVFIQCSNSSKFK